MDHRSFALTRLARKPGCPEAIPGKPADFSGRWLEPDGPDEHLRAAQWAEWLWDLDSSNFHVALGCWVGDEELWRTQATFVWASGLLGIVTASMYPDGHTRY